MTPLEPTAGGFLLVLAIVIPILGALLALPLGSRWAERLVLMLLPAGLAVSVAIAACVWRSGDALLYLLGGWRPPLGIVLRADGLSTVMLVTSALVIGAAALFGRADFRTPSNVGDARAPLAFWTLLMAVWAGLAAVFLGHDLFNLYVALELLTFGAVPLVSLGGRAETFAAALRYLLFALAGSMLYLLGAALLYGAHGTLDIALLSQRIGAEPVSWIAAALMTTGLLAKTALVPLHLWLPPAHAGAPAAASAVLSALVVKGSFFLIVRLWFDVMPELPRGAAAQMLGGLGAAAVLLGSVLALRQARLKLLIAYSTVAQLGYLFLLFPLAAGAAPAASLAWTGGFMQLASHAFAKAGMFMAAGLIYDGLGHDRIAELRGSARALPIPLLVFGLAGLSLMGLPPSGGFVAKWLLLLAAVQTGQWCWALVLLAGGLLAGGYLFRVIGVALARDVDPPALRTPVSSGRAGMALALVLAALLLGFVPLGPAVLLAIGRPEIAVVGLR